MLFARPVLPGNSNTISFLTPNILTDKRRTWHKCREQRGQERLPAKRYMSWSQVRSTETLKAGHTIAARLAAGQPKTFWIDWYFHLRGRGCNVPPSSAASAHMRSTRSGRSG